MSAATIARISVGILCGALAFGIIAPTTSAPTVPTMAACQEEDGSTPGQEFPCRWDAAEQGNGTGQSVTLIYHACTQAEDRVAAAAWAAGHAVPRQCQPTQG